MINVNGQEETAKLMAEAYKSGEEEKVKEAWEKFNSSIMEQMKSDFDEFKESMNEKVLVERGYRQLTSQEKSFYEKLIETSKANNPKQAFADFITDANGDGMPQTIIEDVYKDLVEEHPLLAKINFVNAKYLTKWLLNDHTKQKAVWGAITEAITKEITSSIKEVKLTQNKLSAYAFISKDMLDLGPVFVDAYIRAVLKETLACGLEEAIIKGTGVEMPVGLIKDIHKGVSFSTDTGYPDKTAEVITDFTPSTYGPLVAKLTKKENGKNRKFKSVALICNMTDYLTKVMPATTVLNANGQYVNNLFPFPTDVIVSDEVEDGEAILSVLKDYFCGIGGSKEGVIEYSDEFKFLDDARTYKIKQYAEGRAEDNTVALRLDISGVKAAYVNVKVDGEITSTVEGTVSTKEETV